MGLLIVLGNPKQQFCVLLSLKLRMTFSFKTISCTIVVYRQIQNDVRTNQINRFSSRTQLSGHYNPVTCIKTNKMLLQYNAICTSKLFVLFELNGKAKIWYFHSIFFIKENVFRLKKKQSQRVKHHIPPKKYKYWKNIFVYGFSQLVLSGSWENPSCIENILLSLHYCQLRLKMEIYEMNFVFIVPIQSLSCTALH